MCSLKETWDRVKNLLGAETGIIVLLVSVASFFYSSLLKAGIAQDCLIAFVCNNWKDADIIQRQLRSEEDNQMLPLGIPKETTLRDVIQSRRDDITLFKYSPNRDSERNLQWLLSELTGTAELQQAELPSVTAVAFKDEVPFDAPENLLLCKLPDCSGLLEGMISILPDLENYAEGHEDRILMPLTDFFEFPETYLDHRWLYATAYLLARTCKDIEEGVELFFEYKSALNHAIEESNRLKDLGGLSALFLAALDRYIADFPDRVIHRKESKFQRDCEAHTTVLFDEKRCYIPDQIFHDICAELKETADVKQINRALEHDSIQIPEKMGELRKNTQSIPIYVNGVQKRSRYHVLAVDNSMRPNLRGKLDEIGIIGFEEVREDEY